MSGTMSGLWNRLPARGKRILVFGGGSTALVAFLWLVIPADESAQRQGNRRQDVVSEVMISNNTRAVTVDGLAAQLSMTLDRYHRLEQRFADENRRNVALLESQARQLRREIEGARGRGNAEDRVRLRELEARIAELGGSTPEQPMAAVAPAPAAPQPPAAQQAAADPPAQPAPDTASMRAPAPDPPQPAADPIAFGGRPPRIDLNAGLPPDPPTNPLGDLSPEGVFSQRPRFEPAVAVQPQPQPQGGRRGGATPAAAGGGAMRYIAPPPVERQNQDMPQRRTGEQAFLPAGAILSGVVLAGFDAPTSRQARRDPLPALIRLNDLAILPNRFKADVRECFLLVSGFGDLSSERSYMRGETFSCVLNDGTVVQEKIQAYASGEDGKAGIRGRLVTKQGQFVARALVVGLMQGVAEAFSNTRGVQIGVSGGGGFSFEGAQDNLGSGLARGSGRALDRIAQFYLDQAGDVFPVIEISAGRRVDVILTAGATLRLPG